jgi:hypothetical protein
MKGDDLMASNDKEKSRSLDGRALKIMKNIYEHRLDPRGVGKQQLGKTGDEVALKITIELERRSHQS